MAEPRERLSGDLSERLRRAESFGDDPNLFRAFVAATSQPDLWARVEADAEAFLASQGVEIPQGLAVRFVREPHERPPPDYEFFAIRFTRCRSYWLKKRDGRGYEQVEICHGFEIVPHPLPPIA